MKNLFSQDPHKIRN